MRRLGLALVASLLLPIAPAQAQERCTEVAADTHGRVYTAQGRWYACDRFSAKPIRLAGVRKGALAQVTFPYAAVTTADGKLRMFNLADRSKAAMRLPGRPTDLVLAQGGAAFVVAGGRVLRMNAEGEVVELDAGCGRSKAKGYVADAGGWLLTSSATARTASSASCG